MFIKTQYVGVCSKCHHDVFVEINSYRIDLRTRCECINNRVIRRSWWSTYVYGPAYWKILLFIFCMLLFNNAIAEVIGLGSIIFMVDWWRRRTEDRIYNKVCEIYKDGFEYDDDLINRLIEGYNHGKNNALTTSDFEDLGTRDNHRERQREKSLFEDYPCERKGFPKLAIPQKQNGSLLCDEWRSDSSIWQDTR